MSHPKLNENEELLALVRSSFVWRTLVVATLVFGLSLPCLFFFSIRSFGIELMLFNICAFAFLAFLFSRALRSLHKTMIMITSERVVIRRVPWFGEIEEESMTLAEVDLANFPKEAILFPGSVKHLRQLVEDIRAV